MTKYLVAEIETIHFQDGPAGEDISDTDVKLHMCQDTRAVAVAIRTALGNENDWNVFEMVQGKAERRGVTLRNDGECLYDVIISGS